MVRLLIDAWKTGPELKSKTHMNWLPIEHLRDQKTVLYLLLLSALPLLGFQFGSGNQVEQFAIIARMMDPTFALGDFYIDNAVGFGPRFYYSKFMAGLVGATSFPFAILFLSLLCNFTTGVITFLSARRLLGVSALGAAAAAALAVTNGGFALGLAGFIRFDSFQPASIAIPLSLTGLYFTFSARALIAAFFFASASLFHPLIGVEIGLIGFGAFFLATIISRGIGKELWRELTPQIMAGLVFVTLVFVAWGVPSLLAGTEKIPDKEFFDTLVRFRAPHHYLALGFPRIHYVSFFLFVVSVGAVIVGYVRTNKYSRAIQALVIAALTVLIFCAASIVLVDMLETRFYATAQVFRLLFLVKWIGYLFIGWIMVRWVADHGPVGFVFAALTMISTAEAQARAFTFILVLGWAASHKVFSQRPVLKWALAAITFVGTLYFHKNLGSGTEAIRAIAAVGVFFLIYKFPLKDQIAMAAAAVATTLLIIFATVNRTALWIDKDALTPEYVWADLSGDDIDVARWARVNTPEGVVWATPPDFESFRMVAERGIIVDYTSIPFGDLALRAWKERITTLYGPLEGSGFWALRNMKQNYANWDSEKLRAVMVEHGADYAVLYIETPWDGPILYQNETFKAVQRQKSDQP